MPINTIPLRLHSDFGQQDTEVQGYAGRPYAETFGTPITALPESLGFLQAIAVGATSFHDLRGSEPVFSCKNPLSLRADLAAVAAYDDAVTVTLVLDPVADFSLGELHAWSDCWQPLSDHFIIDLQKPNPSRHHRRQLRLAGRAGIEIKQEMPPVNFLDRWVDLYCQLEKKVSVREQSGRFWPLSTLKAQLLLAETIVFSAWHGENILGADWYMVEPSGCVRAHLSAYTQKGYSLAASYPMLEFAIKWFADQGYRLIDLGGVPSAHKNDSGLYFFKNGWATHKRQRWLMGKILRPEVYNRLVTELCEPHPFPACSFFPAYRNPCFLPGTDLEIHR